MSRHNSRPASGSLPGAGLSDRPRVLNSPRSVIESGFYATNDCFSACFVEAENEAFVGVITPRQLIWP
jgi:hypothetical protein